MNLGVGSGCSSYVKWILTFYAARLTCRSLKAFLPSPLAFCLSRCSPRASIIPPVLRASAISPTESPTSYRRVSFRTTQANGTKVRISHGESSTALSPTGGSCRTSSLRSLVWHLARHSARMVQHSCRASGILDWQVMHSCLSASGAD